MAAKKGRRDMPWREAIEKVLGDASGGLHYTDVANRIAAEGLRENVGATPAATVAAVLSTSMKQEGAASPFVRVERGVFGLKSKLAESGIESNGEADTPSGAAEEEQYDIVTSFGMFWRREGVLWKASPSLLGMQQLGATPVNFCDQRGIYLLYDGREVIYVGRTTDRSLGRRLYEHTMDRLSSRWDRFSWFGILPVSDQGVLAGMPEAYDAAKLIPALEAILIEALEPRQNRKRGDDLAAVEYLHKLDPEIEKQRVKATMEAAINRL